MKAAFLEGTNQPLVLREAPVPVPRTGEVLVRVKAAALNHRDVWIRQGQYAGLRYPCIVGSDGAGIVTEVGPEADKSWIGKEVMINPGLFWGDNRGFPSKEFRILGLPDDGTLAEYVKIPASHVYAKPAHLSFEEAAAIPLAGVTAFRALFSRAGLQPAADRPGEKVLITGIGGGVALFALQFAVASGAQVFVTSGSDEKIERAKTLGALGGVNYTEEDWSKKLAVQANGFDVIIDSAGGEGFARLIELAAPGGRLAIFGGTRGAWKEVSPQRVFFKQLSIFGSTMGSAAEFEAMIRLMEGKKLKPVIDRVYPFVEVEQAMQRMAQSKQFGKLVLKVS